MENSQLSKSKMTLLKLYLKVKNRLWSNLVRYSKGKSFYPYFYCSYWYFMFFRSNETINNTSYFAARPNRGAGIGHQLANWIAGYWFAKQFGLKFAHIPFSTSKWEDFLGFNEGEVTVNDLVRQGYKKVKLPLFNEFNPKEEELTRNIINSYDNKKVVFIAEQDQFYQDQFGVIEDIQRKFHNAKARKNDQLIYSTENFNVAIHVRRGDIVVGKQTNNPNLSMRWQDNDYFTNVLTSVLEKLKTNKPIAIYLFSQGGMTDFKDFSKFPNLHFCLDRDAQESFLHMVFADLLITSKSSFSYKPALLNNGIKVCPADFWHGYPKTEDWILVDNEGYFNKEIIVNL